MGKILITWTNSGIWKYLAENFKSEHEIFWVWRKNNSIEWINFIMWDLRWESFLKEISKKIKEIDYLILNAWVGYFWRFKEIDMKNHTEILETNLFSKIMMTYLLLDKVKHWIIFIWSIAWKKSFSHWATYAASKFWIRWFAMQLKNEITWKKVHIINPSIVKTNFHNKSTFPIVWKYRENSLEEIFEVIKNIINWEEKRFEIDL